MREGAGHTGRQGGREGGRESKGERDRGSASIFPPILPGGPQSILPASAATAGICRCPCNWWAMASRCILLPSTCCPPPFPPTVSGTEIRSSGGTVDLTGCVIDGALRSVAASVPCAIMHGVDHLSHKYSNGRRKCPTGLMDRLELGLGDLENGEGEW